MRPDDILEPLDPEQREVARALGGPVCVLAGAGTGKTRAITHRIAYGVSVNAYQAPQVLAVTFTARAAGEMRQRLRALGVDGVQARTFHAAALRQLGYFWPEVVGGQIPAIAPQKGALVGEAARRVGMSVDRIAVRDLASEIEWAKVSLVAAGDYATLAEAQGRPQPAGVARALVADLMREYEDVKTEKVLLDFEDILLILADVMARHREVGDTIRRQYRHFVVDEYQDVSPLQQYLLDQWLGGRDEICVVGDPSQTIYSFAGASPRHLTSFPRLYPHATVVRLVRDYRSTPQVVRLANDLMHTRGGGAVELVAQRPSGPAVAFQTYPDGAAEAAGTAERISALVSAGVPLREIAVLYRTNGQSEVLEDALAQRGIAYLVRGGARFFDREEVKRAMVMLRGAAVVPSSPEVPIAVREALDGVGWSEEPPAARGAVRERWDSLQALVDLADDWEGTLREFVDDLGERAQAQHAPAVDGVTLTTLHAAKGLEWDAVFIVGLSEGLLPISMAETEAAIEEERRLLYVGITRAREHLVLSYGRSRAEGGRASRKRTRFLEKWWPEVRVAPPKPKAAAADLTVADLRLFESLKAWRLAHAEADAKPAFTVLVDASLAEIASKRPATLGQLATVRGVGPSKLDRYGIEIIEIVAADPVRP
jgi:DNA helicase-2/ATP-dependent DNA helicase PcrA